MNLTDWTRLSKHEQSAQISSWRKEEQLDVYFRIAADAADLLFKKLESCTEASDVAIDRTEELGDQAFVNQLGLLVYTTVDGERSPNEIPTEFHGFQVRQVNLGGKRREFTAIIARVFDELLGWNECMTREWLNDSRWSDGLDGRRPPIIYHHGPLKTAAIGLLEESNIELEGSDKIQLQNRILGIFDGVDDTESHPSILNKYDWSKIKASFERLIDQSHAAESGKD